MECGSPRLLLAPLPLLASLPLWRFTLVVCVSHHSWFIHPCCTFSRLQIGWIANDLAVLRERKVITQKEHIAIDENLQVCLRNAGGLLAASAIMVDEEGGRGRGIARL